MQKLALSISAVMLLALTTSANALSIPFVGTFSGTGTSNGSNETFVGTGTDNTFGPFNATESATIALSGPNPPNISLTNGTFDFTFGSGSLIGTFTGSGTSPKVTISFLITAGLLPGDTGSATGTGEFDSDTNTVTGSYSGNIFGPDGPNACVGLTAGFCVNNAGALVLSPAVPSPTPLPAALPLFATGLGGLGLLGWRKKKKAVAA
jgi:hypothetical protein